MISMFRQRFGGSHQLLWIILCFATLGYHSVNKRYSRQQLLLQSAIAVILASSYNAFKPVLSLMPSWSMAAFIAFFSLGIAKVKELPNVKKLAVVRIENQVPAESDPLTNELKSIMDESFSREDLLAGLQLSISNCYRPQIKLVGLTAQPKEGKGNPAMFMIKKKTVETPESVECGDGPLHVEAGARSKTIHGPEERNASNDGGLDVKFEVQPTGDSQKDRGLMRKIKAAMEKITLPKRSPRSFFAAEDSKESDTRVTSQLTLNNYGKCNATDTDLSDVTERIRHVHHLGPGKSTKSAEGSPGGNKSTRFSPFRTTDQRDVSMEVGSEINPMSSILTRKTLDDDDDERICKTLNLNDTVESWSPLLESLSMHKLREPPPPTPSLSKTWKDEFAGSKEVKKLNNTPASKVLSVTKSGKTGSKGSEDFKKDLGNNESRESGDSNFRIGYAGNDTLFLNATMEGIPEGLAGPFYLAIGDKLPPGLIPVDISVNDNNQVTLKSQEFSHNFASVPKSPKVDQKEVALKKKAVSFPPSSKKAWSIGRISNSKYAVGFLVSLSLFTIALSQVATKFFVNKTGSDEDPANAESTDSIGKLLAIIDQRLMVPRHTWFGTFAADEMKPGEQDFDFSIGTLGESSATIAGGGGHKQGAIDWEYVLELNKLVGIGLISITLLWHLAMLVIPVVCQIFT